MSEGATKKEHRRKFQAVKGTRDILPPETALWNRVERTARDVFATYGFGEIRVPIFEPTELFARAVGNESEIVSKEMYTFEDRPLDVTRPHLMGEYEGFLQTVKKLQKSGSLPNTQANLAAITNYEKFWSVFKETWTDVDSLLKATYFASEIKLGADLALRPEGTASVCRAYIENGMHQLPQPVKLYYMGPMFRRERPQKGRHRQFYQIGAEVLEVMRPDASRDLGLELKKDAAIDAEVIEMLMTFFAKCGLHSATLEINSIGHDAPNCRPRYVSALKAAIGPVRGQLDDDSKRRVETNPLRVLDSKADRDQPLIATLPRIGNYLCDECRSHYSFLKHELDLRQIEYRENWRLVRGLDYYMRTTFEITAPGLGSQNAVCGGGRYDGLVEQLGGPPTKGIGFAIGEDRLILSLQYFGTGMKDVDEALPDFATVLQRPDVAVAATTKETWDRAVQLATQLRKRGLSVYLPKAGSKLQRALEAAQNLGIRVAILVGEDELKTNEYAIRVLSPIEDERQRDFSVPSDDVLFYGKLAKLRQNLERAMIRLATGKPDISARRSMPSLIQGLLEKRLLPASVAQEVGSVLPILNRAIHGEDLNSESVQRALVVGTLLLSELENLSPMEA